MAGGADLPSIDVRNENKLKGTHLILYVLPWPERNTKGGIKVLRV